MAQNGNEYAYEYDAGYGYNDPYGDYEYGDEYEDEEEMPATERELAEDAQWKLIQKNTFTRWANEHLKTVNKHLAELETDFSDGLRLLALVEVLSGKKFSKFNRRPNFRTQKLENVTMCLKFLEDDEGIRIVNIDSSDIVDCKLKLILGLIWTLILHYSISMPMWDDEPIEDSKTPKQRLLGWVQNKVPDRPIHNFTTDWNDGIAIGALVDSVAPGLCPDWEDWNPKNNLANATEAMDAAENWLDVPQLIKPAEMNNPKIDELSMMTYLSQFPNAKLKPNAPLRPKTNPGRVRAYGPGIEPTGNCVGAPARFIVETFNAGAGQPEVTVLNPRGQPEPCEVNFNNDRNLTYSVVYTPTMEGQYRVIVKFAGKEIPKSPFPVGVAPMPGDASKVTAEGPGIEKTGNVVNKKTHFQVFCVDAGAGVVDVAILDPHGRKDTVRPMVTQKGPELWQVDYTPTEEGLHSVNVFFAAKAIPLSPFAVQVQGAPGLVVDPNSVHPASMCPPLDAARASLAPPTPRGNQQVPRKPEPIQPMMAPPMQYAPPPPPQPSVDSRRCYATGRGIQPKGVRVQDNADFRVHTEGAGVGELKVVVQTPNGQELPTRITKIEASIFQVIYVPQVAGHYVITVTYGGGHIYRSPFNVEVGPYKESRIVAFGPGLEGGVVNMPANFTVETNGETGALGFSIEGPSQAKIDCKDNGDGSADISYFPTTPGEYAVHILCNEEDIPKSPYMADIKPNDLGADFNPDKVIATGPGLEKTGNTVNKWAEFSVDTRRAGKAPLGVTCMDVDYASVDVLIKDNSDGTFWCRYMPRRNVKHTIIITYGAVGIPASPYRVYVQEASNPSKVRVYGPAVEAPVKTFNPTHLIVDCSEAGPGDVAIALRDERGIDVAVNTTDNQDNTFRIDFEARSAGQYSANVFFADQEIPSSPYPITVEPSIDLSKVHVQGLEDNIPVGKEKSFNIITTGAGPGQAQVAVVSPTGKVMTAKIEPSMDGFLSKFTPFEAGPHQIHVTFANLEVPGSPFNVTAIAAKVEPPKGDPTKVKAYGPGLRGGTANTPADFTIDTRDAGPGGLGLTIEGPCEAKIDCFDKGNGTCDVRYWPTEPGDYKINILFADEPIPHAPFTAKIEPDKRVDVSGIRAYGPGILPNGVFLESTTDFTVDARSVTSNGEGLLKSFVTAPSGMRTEVLVNNNNDGTYKCMYTPMEQGPHKVDVTYEGLQIPKSPFPVQVSPGCDPTRVRAYGPGLTGGMTDEPAIFTVETRGAGQGGLGLAIEGPSEAKMTCRDNRDGSCTVEYLPTKKGDYDIKVKFADIDIPGSPFRARITDPVNPGKVHCYGEGIEPAGVRAGLPTEFVVDAVEAGDAKLDVTLTDSKGNQETYSYGPDDFPESKSDKEGEKSDKDGEKSDKDGTKSDKDGTKSDKDGAKSDKDGAKSNKDGAKSDKDGAQLDKDGNRKPVQITPQMENVYSVAYVPDAVGTNRIDVAYAGKPVPGSPFMVPVKPGSDPAKVKVYGEGVQPTGVLASIPTSFTVDSTEAGTGQVEVIIKDPEGKIVRPQIQDNHNGTYLVTYCPEDLGTYRVEVKFANQQVPNSPFLVKTSPTGDASKVKLPDPLPTTIPVGDECVIAVNAVEAGHGNVTCRIRSDAGSDVDIDIVDNADGTVSLMYTPRIPGAYTVNIKFGGVTVPRGDFIQQAEDLIQADMVDAVHAAAPESFHPVDFCIPVGPIFNFVSAVVTTPSGQKEHPKIQDNKNGTVTMKYQPSEAGLHLLEVTYNNQPIPGSPFKFHVDAVNSGYVYAHGPGLSHGIAGQPAYFTIVTKDAGAGGLALAVEGPSKAEINCTDNKDGTCSVSYLPYVPGEYSIIIKFADAHISGSPFIAKISGPGEDQQRAQLSVGSSSEVSLKVTETDIASLTATIRSPSGIEEPCMLKRLPNGHLGISFTPREIGEHLVNVYRHGKHIPNSPFKIYVGESEIGNASKVKVSGRGLVEGMANELNEFVVNTKEAGYGGLSLSIEGPSKADIECHDNEDGSCRVTYRPTEPGNYIVNVKFADEHVPGSPFLVKIGGEPSGRITERITRQREAADITHVGSQCELSLKIPGTSPYDMEASVRSPSGLTEMCDINQIEDGHYSIKFVPKEMGIHTVSVKHKGLHIPGSPFQFTVGPITGGGAHKVRAMGPGLERGEVTKPCEFNIYTREAGAGGLSIAAEGPSKAEIDFQDHKDGSCGVSYTVTESGEYMVSVKFNDQHIPDSPFKVYIGGSNDNIRKLSVQSLQQSGLQINKPAAFTVDFNGAQGKLDASVIAPSGAQDEAIVQEVDKDKYAVRFIPRENGLHMIHVRLNGSHIPGSPFRVHVGTEDADPSLVRAFGDGLTHGNTGQKCEFIVNTVNAGSGALAVTIDGPSKVQLTCVETDEGYKFSYTPTAPGDYLITIKYGGAAHIPGSPFKARIEGAGTTAVGVWNEQSQVVVETVTKTSTTQKFAAVGGAYESDPSKVQVSGAGLTHAKANQEMSFRVDASTAGHAVLLVGMLGPEFPCEEIHVHHQGGNRYSVNYLVREPGQYLLVIKWGDQHVPGSPYHITVN